MSRHFVSLFVAVVCAAPLTLACDSGEPLPEDFALDAPTLVDTELDIDVDIDTNVDPAGTAPFVGELDFDAAREQAENLGGWTFESFRYAIPSDTISFTSAPGGLFAPSPAGIPLLDGINADGVLASVTLRDFNDAIVGFASEHEIVDPMTLEAEGTYTITLPDRGTLMLGQREDLSPLIVEINDMVASQEFIRSYDPPLVIQNTIPATGRVIGGTGEFGHAKGFAREIGVIHELNLLTLDHDLEIVLQLLYKT